MPVLLAFNVVVSELTIKINELNRSSRREGPKDRNREERCSFRSRRSSAQPTAGRPKAGRPEAARGHVRGAGDRSWLIDGRVDGRRRLTRAIAKLASTKPIDKGCIADARTPARNGAVGVLLPRGVGETYTDAWTARSNAEDRSWPHRGVAAYGRGRPGCEPGGTPGSPGSRPAEYDTMRL